MRPPEDDIKEQYLKKIEEDNRRIQLEKLEIENKYRMES